VLYNFVIGFMREVVDFRQHSHQICLTALAPWESYNLDESAIGMCETLKPQEAMEGRVAIIMEVKEGVSENPLQHINNNHNCTGVACCCAFFPLDTERRRSMLCQIEEEKVLFFRPFSLYI